MALKQYLILEDFRAKEVSLSAGDLRVWDDADKQLMELIRSGLSVAEYDPVLMADPLRAYLVQRDLGQQPNLHFGFLLGNLIASPAGASTIGTTTPGETVQDQLDTLGGAMGSLDHGSDLAAASLLDDDHTIYLLADGTRPLGGNWSVGGNSITNLPSPSAGTDAVNKDYVDAILLSTVIDWKESVKDFISTPPGGPAPGDRYLILATGTGAWAGRDNEIATWDGAAWIFDQPNEGATAYIEATNRIYIFDGLVWNAFGSILDHGSLTNLANDSHTQYLLVNGTRAMSGNLSMGGQNITNVNLVDGIDVTAHGSRHDPGGADPVTTATPVAIGAVNAPGVAASLVRSDHVHAHGNQGGGSEHALVIASGAAGFISGADKAKLDGIPSGATNDHGLLLAASLLDDDHTQYLLVDGTRAMTGNLDLGSNNISNVGTVNLVTVEGHEARHRPGGADALPVGVPVTIGASNAQGVATAFSRSDHQHNHGNQTNELHHALAAAGVSHGFMSSADKTKLDGIAAGAASDHGALSGLGDDDHTIYTKADGTRAFSGNQSMGNFRLTSVAAPVAGTDAANKDYVDAAINGLDWQESVIDKDLTTPPGGPIAGDRYIVAAVATGAWVGQENKIAQWSGTSWAFFGVNEGHATWVEDEDKQYVYNGTSWVTLGATTSHGALSGLGADDHTQYLLVDGTRAMTGNLDMGGQNITNVNLVDGFDLSTFGALSNTAPPVLTVTAGTSGVSAEAARQDHRHNISTAAAVNIGTANATGTSTFLSRADHVHNHGAQTDPTQHAVAVAGVSNGFISSADQTKVNQIITSGSRLYPPSATNPVAPVPSGGDMYYNTAIDQMMYYDPMRLKWLSVSEYCVTLARSGPVGTGTALRTLEVLQRQGQAQAQQVPVLGANITLTRGVVHHSGLLGSNNMEVRQNNVVVATVTHPGDGSTFDVSALLNVDLNPITTDQTAGFGMRVGTGANVTDVVMSVYYKLRV